MNDHDIMYVLSPLVLLHQNVFFFLAVQEKIVYLYCYKENERNVTFATTYIVLLLRHVVLYPPAACVCVSSWPSRPSWPSHVCPIYPIYNDMIRYDMICKTLFFSFWPPSQQISSLSLSRITRHAPYKCSTIPPARGGHTEKVVLRYDM